jgi:alpha-glucosidase
VIDAAKALEVPISPFHFGSGYTSIGGKRYVFAWNREKFPEPKALMRAFADAGMKVVANVKRVCLTTIPAMERSPRPAASW